MSCPPYQMSYVIFASCGNDSVALIEYARQQGLSGVKVCYSNTGWAAPWWPERVAQVAEYCESIGFDFVEIVSEGMESLVRRKKGWPMCATAMQFCTKYLKTEPALNWLEGVDPDKEATCMIGVRRSESQNRATFPEWTSESEKHGGRELWAPLVRHGDEQRDVLIKAAGFEVLPHRSMECFPCVCSNRDDLRELAKYPERIKAIGEIEKDMGHTRNDKPRTMFRPYRHAGAKGIEEVVKWASYSEGQYKPGQDDLFTGCDSGWCGS